jgi:hypothetical protein
MVRMIHVVRNFADDTKLGLRAGTAQERESMQKALNKHVPLADK